RKCVDRAMLATLRFVQTPATRKNKIYLPEELFLEHWQLRIGALESRQFVHAVINRRDWSELIREFERHRGVVPKDISINLMLDKKLSHHLFHDRVYRELTVQTIRKLWHDDVHSGLSFKHFAPHLAVA